MSWLRDAFRRVHALFRRSQLDADMAEEMRAHLEMQQQENCARGMSPEEARYAAQRQFGGVDQIKELAREQRGIAWLDAAVREGQFALRRLAKSPGYTIVALATLALGIGVNVSMFSALWMLMFRTPYPDDHQLVRLFRTGPQFTSSPHSAPNFLDLRTRATAFQQLAAAHRTDYNLAAPDEPAERLHGLNVTGDFFSLLGTAPELGQVFTEAEDQFGKNGVVVLSHGAWVQHFAQDPNVIGRQIRLDGTSVTVVAVMPKTFDFVSLWGHVQAWRPIGFDNQERLNRGDNFLTVIGRLKPGVTTQQAQAEVSTIGAQLAEAYPRNNAKTGLRIVSLARSTQDGLGANLTWMVAGLGGFVLLIACVNLANLQFAQHTARAHEQAIRSALGASRRRLIAGAFSESLLLALGGSALGLCVAAWCNDVLAQRFVIDGASGFHLPLDFHAIGFALFAAVVTGFGFGGLPAWMSSRPDLDAALKEGGRCATVGRTQSRLRGALIVAEVALALMLLASAGLFLRGIERGLSNDLGWRAEGMLTGSIALRGQNYATKVQRQAFHEKLLDRLRSLPGVESAAFGSSLPTWGLSEGSTFFIEDRPAPASGLAPQTRYADITPGYFDTLKLPLRTGRDFNADDRAGSRPVAIINETLARTFWPGENPIGKRLGWDRDWREVVGVVSDAASAKDVLGNHSNRFQLYRPLAQIPDRFIELAVRTQLAPEKIAQEMQRAVAAIDSDQPVFDVQPVPHQIDRELANLRLAGQMLAAFALLGLVLAAVGIYGVISGSVAQRTTEIGVRMALGAQVYDVLALVLGQGLRLTAIGAALGLIGVWGIARLLHALMPGLPAAEFATVAAITVLLFGVAAAACWIPARRAANVDATVALRAE